MRAIDWRRTGKLLGTVLFIAVVLLFVSIAIPQIVGADQSYVVQSDSMSPTIDAGSVVYVADVTPDRLSENEIITYRRGSENPVTHRIVEVVERDGQELYRTKGDANEGPDPTLVSADQVIGRVAFSIPYMGYVVAFAGTDLGIALLIIVPALLLAATELWELFVARDEDEPERTEGETG
ncbi:peptidase S26B, signal peptidase [Halorhabdus utahensis DSM 12940]|uniref:Peptidase S26B, signal peptidase n=1 Tax=Halorhabdus utahensis (strain DSM 12940 / JCM 11049 / AX-2) TaxID=519442 RepID=C7NN88_HALUD|nr:signal peptidase I [Halorhabdus utahensis]ACV11488.1 peptidase S26B, signal peptidase [Halorhabdus utahensis DSM 12940]